MNLMATFRKSEMPFQAPLFGKGRSNEVSSALTPSVGLGIP
ncbi:MAG: hypothetical protein Q4F50_06935 [Bacteroides sp.]|nr:hypothetical protein [Bacteroides sp.]MDO5419779.1 hypothetical protein [Bacteroides sp.]